MSARKECFIISTIGEKDSNERKIADEKFDLVFEPVLKEANYNVTRADKIGTPGSISYDIVQRIITSELVIADVSDLNPNVFYELAIRNAIKKPVIVIKGIAQKMPFDIYDKRAISVDMKEARIWTESKKQLGIQIKEAEKDEELASKSILTDFTFPLDTEKKFSPDKELIFQMKDMQGEIRRLRSELHESSQKRLSDYDDSITMGEMLITQSRVSKLQSFMDILKKLEGRNKKAVPEDLLLKKLMNTGNFGLNEAKDTLRQLLREASVYESKPGHYNRV